MIHVWMIHKRLITEGREGQRLQEALFDQLWEDTSNRIRAVGIGELSVSHMHGHLDMTLNAGPFYTDKQVFERRAGLFLQSMPRTRPYRELVKGASSRRQAPQM